MAFNFLKGRSRKAAIAAQEEAQKKAAAEAEANKIERHVEYDMEDCVHCHCFNHFQKQAQPPVFLVQCTRDNPNIYHVSSPQLLRKMFEECPFWPKVEELTFEPKELANADQNNINQ